jgi:two-component system NtrC family sensor kinase
MIRRLPLALIIIGILLILGGINIYKKAVWKEPTDGVFWQEKAGRHVAAVVEAKGPAYLHGIKKGDILYSINDLPIVSKIDIVKNHWAAWTTGQKIKYQIGRGGELLFPSFFLTQRGSSLLYFYLALIGLTTLVISIIVFFNSRKTFSVPYLYFYLLCLALYSIYVFSPTGKMDFLDNTFYWLDEAAFLFFPPLLLHFFLIFPQRKKVLRKRPNLPYFLYLPGGLLLLATVTLFLPLSRGWDDSRIFAVYRVLERLQVFHFAVFATIALFSIFHSRLRLPGLLIKKQLRWILAGLGLGVLPFTVFYAVPFFLGHKPSPLAELTVLLQALIPLTFAYSVSRSRIMDFEVLIKKAATLIFSYFVLACLYVVLSSQTRVFSENRLNVLILGILAMILGATLFTPIKRLFTVILDRIFYKRAYKYRKTLLLISKELSRERNLEKLSQSLMDLITNALTLQNLALLLPENESGTVFRVVGSKGQSESMPSHILIDGPFLEILMEQEFISLDSSSERRAVTSGAEPLTALGFAHFLPLRVEDKLIGCLAMGKKTDNSYLNVEDWELLTTISSPAALAIENASLYNQASVRATELERLKDYSENIIESLTVGVAVLNQQSEVLGWNRVLEASFARKKKDVLGKSIQEVLGPKNCAALFPTDTQQDYRLLSEITLEMPTGQKRIFDIAKTPLLDNKMVPYGTIIVFEDITEKIHLQQQLVTSEKLASIGLLSAGVAHEINTPLTGISSYIQMLQKSLADSHYAKLLEKIEVQTERVSKIIKNLLNFARNPAESSFHKVNIVESLQEIISLIDYKLKAMNIRLEMKLTGSVRPIWAQGERIQQVFINIILNAIDAMPRGGTLRIDPASHDNEAVVKISDTGTGIKKQHLPHIFDPFFTTKGIGKGTGLGLSIAYAIIKEHEGHIEVESEAGKGTCFTIFIPADLEARKKGPKTPYAARN